MAFKQGWKSQADPDRYDQSFFCAGGPSSGRVSRLPKPKDAPCQMRMAFMPVVLADPRRDLSRFRTVSKLESVPRISEPNHWWKVFTKTPIQPRLNFDD